MTDLTTLKAEAHVKLKDVIPYNGDGHYCIHHPDDPGHGDGCYEMPEYIVKEIDSLIDRVHNATLDLAEGAVPEKSEGHAPESISWDVCRQATLQALKNLRV